MTAVAARGGGGGYRGRTVIEEPRAVRLFPASLVAAAVLLPVHVVPAAASGGIGCQVRDAGVTLDVGIGMARSGGGFFNVDARLAIASTDLPADMRSLVLDEALVHDWLDADELKLHFHHERAAGDFMSLDLVIEAEAVEEGLFAGDYVVSVFGVAPPVGDSTDTWSVKGTVVCFVE